MSCDIIVSFPEGRPSRVHIRNLLEDFFSGVAELAHMDGDEYCTLPGTPASPFRSVSKGLSPLRD